MVIDTLLNKTLIFW